MGRFSHTHRANIVLDLDEGYIECPAEFEVSGEQYPAEPHTHGRRRGMEAEVRAELVMFRLGGASLSRDTAVAILSEAEVKWQENLTADAFADSPSMGDAA